MLYGLATLTTQLPSVADPSDFTNYVSQDAATFLAAMAPPSAAQPTPVATQQPSRGVLVLGAVGLVAWYWFKRHKGKGHTNDGTN